MTHRTFRSTPLRPRLRLVGLAALLTGVACAPKAVQTAPVAAPVAPVSQPVAVAAPVVSQSCPGATDGPSIVIDAITEAHRALVANPATPLPPVCVFTAFASISRGRPDSLLDHTLALVDESRRRGAEPPALMSAEVLLYASARRYPEVTRTYTRLLATDSTQATLDVSRAAIAAAHQTADTAALLRALGRAAATPSAGATITTEYSVVRQAARLWTAIRDGQGMVRQNPKYVAAYPSIVTNFGTLGLPDSVIAVVRRALAQSAPRATLSTAMDILVATMLRHGSLYGDTEGWDAPIAASLRVDSALTSPSTKFLVAALITYAANTRITDISTQIGSPTMSPSRDPAALAHDAQNRSAGCQRLAPLTALLDVADARLRDGGDRYTGANPAPVHAGLAGVRTQIAALQEGCPRGGD